MGWGDALAMARKELLRRPGRAFLTMVSVALAASLLTALVAIATTARTRVLDQITHGGPLSSISVSPAAPNPSQAGLDDPTPGASKVITAGAIRSIAKIPGVVSVIPVLEDRVIIVPPGAPPVGSRLCADPSAGTSCHPSAASGTIAVTVSPYGDSMV